MASVLTASEDVASLKRLADGLMRRYEAAGEQPPSVLRDCCAERGQSKMETLFGAWPDLNVRLDIWHFMRRLAQGMHYIYTMIVTVVCTTSYKGITTESHPLYGVFMAAVSNCIFEWDKDDYQLLMTAKRHDQELVAGVQVPTEAAVMKAITREEAARHCRRRTWGVAEMEQMLENLLLSFSSATDTLGVPLL